MKKLSLILVMLVGVALASCENKGSDKITSKYMVKVIDGCEYIIFDTYSGYVGHGYMSHKGNCKNKIHCYNQK